MFVFSVISARESFSHLLFCHNHLFYRASEFFIVPWVLFVEILKLPFSHDPVRKGFDHFSFSDVMYLGT
jgi:hypothetical protein